MAEYYLIHSGILGMKWGQRRFQYKDGSLTPAGKIRYGVGDGRKSRAERKAEKKKAAQRSAALEKARKAKAEKKKRQEEKDRILREGSASDLLKIKGELTNKELSDAYQRLNNVSLISAIAAKETPKGKSAVDKILSYMDTASAFTSKAYTIYDNSSKFAKKFKEILDEDEKQQKKEKEEALEKIIRSSNVDLILSNAKNMSGTQLENAKKRIGNLEGLRAYSKNMKADKAAKKENKKQNSVNDAINKAIKSGDKVKINSYLSDMSYDQLQYLNLLDDTRNKFKSDASSASTPSKKQKSNKSNKASAPATNISSSSKTESRSSDSNRSSNDILSSWANSYSVQRYSHPSVTASVASSRSGSGRSWFDKKYRVWTDSSYSKSSSAYNAGQKYMTEFITLNNGLVIPIK